MPEQHLAPAEDPFPDELDIETQVERSVHGNPCLGFGDFAEDVARLF